MLIETVKLHYLIDKYIDEFIFYYQNDIVIEGKKHKSGSQILFLHILQLAKSGVKEVDTQFNVTLYEYLIKEFPADYRRPVQWVDANILAETLAELEQVNTQSQRKRYLYIVGDVCGKPGRIETVFKHGDRLDYQKWKAHKAYIDTAQKFFFRNSENGIIAFGDIEYDECFDSSGSFQKKLDLIGSMISYKFDKKFEISPDFIPYNDVHFVDNPGTLAEEYINTGARLIVFNENLTKQQKEALLQVKRYDPFVRMMVMPVITQYNIGDILLQLKMVYNTDYWKNSNSGQR